MTGPAVSPRVEALPRTAYPPARRADVMEQLAGHRVADPYRWLEDLDSAESRAWLVASSTGAGLEEGNRGDVDQGPSRGRSRTHRVPTNVAVQPAKTIQRPRATIREGKHENGSS